MWINLRCAFIVVLLLAVIFVPTKGDYKVIKVGCKDDLRVNYATTRDTLIDQDGDCTSANCSCHSLDDALANLTSNTMINITTDVTLSLVLVAQNISNISIVGHRSPTVKCSNNVTGGALHFSSCHNCRVEKIVWDQCGSQTVHQHKTPVIQFQKSSNVKIQNCCFKNSLGQGIVLLEVIGDVIINNCKFVGNHLYTGNGSAVYYESSEAVYKIVFLISNCNFTHNEGSSSIVYVGPSTAHLSLKNSVFHENKGSSLFISNTGLNISGTVMFEENLAQYGGGISVNAFSSIRFCKDSITIFKKNEAIYNGGAIYMYNHVKLLFDQDSRVSLLNNKASEGGAIYSDYNSFITSEENSVIDFSGNLAKSWHGGAMSLINTSIILNNSTMRFNNNSAKGGGGALSIQAYCSNIAITGKSVVNFDHNIASLGGAIHCYHNSNLKFHDNAMVTFSNNTATNTEGGAIYLSGNCGMTFEQFSVVTFINNSAITHGGAVYILDSIINFKHHSHVNFSYNSVKREGGAIFSYESAITFGDDTLVTFHENSADEYGGSLSVTANSWIIFRGSSVVTFKFNKAKISGGGIEFTGKYTYIICKKDSVLEFTGNSAQSSGGAMACITSNLIVDGHSSVNVSISMATYGGAIYAYDSCNLIFKGYSTVSYYSNIATEYGGVIFSESSCNINFQGESAVTFYNNNADVGGAICLYRNSIISANENSSISFYDNEALNGGSISLNTNCHFTIDGNCSTVVSNNVANVGGAMYVITNSSICYKGISTATFINNEATLNNGGAIGLIQNCSFDIQENSKISFISNHARFGGAIYLETNCHIQIINNSSIILTHNSAVSGGGALYLGFKSDLNIRNFPTILFNMNNATSGGAVYLESMSCILIGGNSTVLFSNNSASIRGGGLFATSNAEITYKENSSLIFYNNSAGKFGGAVCVETYSKIIFTDNCNAIVYNNSAIYYGGAMYLYVNSIAMHKGSSLVTYSNNTATSCGGGVQCVHQSDIIFDELSTLLIDGNMANIAGGGISLTSQSNMIAKGNSALTFVMNNVSWVGGAIYTKKSYITLAMNSTITFNKNNALIAGGAVRVEKASRVTTKGKSKVAFINNIAGFYGGAINGEDNCSFLFSQNSTVHLSNNTAVHDGGALHIVDNIHINVIGNSVMQFTNNIAKFGSGGAAYLTNSKSTINESATVIFSNCVAYLGGGLALNKSLIVFTGDSSVTYINNTAVSGGAIAAYNDSISEFTGNTTLQFDHNSATDKGGAVISNKSNILFSQSSKVTFNRNKAELGDSIFSGNNSTFTITENSLVKFNNNSARWPGGELYSNRSYDIIVDDNGTVTCNGKETFPICINEICFCKDIDNALAILNMSNNVLMILTVNVMLSSIVKLHYVNNFTIIGYNNPTINCNSKGGLYFTSCHECTFEGINWSECGMDENGNQPVIKFENSSNITIKNCSFQHSVGPAIALSEVSGNVIISHCKFVNITHYNEHGAAIHYSSHSSGYFLMMFIVSNCNFIRNTGAMSVVYIEQQDMLLNHIVILKNISFTDNRGTMVHLLSQNVYVEGQNLFIDNQADNGSCIYASNSVVIFSNNSVVRFYNNTALNNGGVLYLNDNATVSFEGNSNVEFNNNNVTNNGGSIYSNGYSAVKFSEYSNVYFSNNTAKRGGALYSEGNCNTVFEQQCTVTFEDNKADFGGALYAGKESIIVFTGNSTLMFQSNVVNEKGGSIYLYNTSDVIFTNNTFVTFYNNTAAISGGAAYFASKSNIKFQENSTVMFNNNTAVTGGAIVSQNKIDAEVNNKYQNVLIENDENSNGTTKLVFGGKSKVTFSNNDAEYGGAIYNTQNIIIDENSNIIFSKNNALYGGAIYLKNNGNMIFKGTSIPTLTNKNSYQNYTESQYCNSTSNEISSITSFHDNIAKYTGGAVHVSKSSVIVCAKKFTCRVTFSNNTATNGGAIHCEDNSSVILGGRSTVIFTSNEATHDGGAIHCYNNSDVMFNECLSVKFQYNKATQGGAIYSGSNSDIIFRHNSITEFINNTGLQHGGAMFIKLNCNVHLEEDSTIQFVSNNALINGGSVYADNNTAIIIIGHSTVTFNNSISQNGYGGAIYSNIDSKFICKGNSELVFTSNCAVQGGTIYSSFDSSIIFDENTTVGFENNTAISGGAVHVDTNSSVILQGSIWSTVMFDNNKAVQNGGAINLMTSSAIVLKGSMTVKYSGNSATSGGAIYANDKSNVTLTGNSNVIFNDNDAKVGGAVYATTSNINFNENCSVVFCNNTAWQDGGAVYLDNHFSATFTDYANITFDYNTASDYGGAMYSKISQSKIIVNTSSINFYNNHARTAGHSWFINVPTSCNSSCLSNSVVGINKDSLEHSQIKKNITTTPRELKLFQPAICIDKSKNKTECNTYYVNNIMLGEELLVDACMYDYYDRPSNDARFEVSGDDNQDYYIPGSQYVLVSCNSTVQGISLNGNTVSPALPSNYSMTLTLYINRLSEMKQISVNLTVELVTCHPGYWYYHKSGKCSCYNDSDIVFCSGSSSSTIKRGYWFGSVMGKPTVTFCPINYCNFTCCETSNGYYELSPARVDQCRSHRSGAACGSCEEGYTLSFDSSECVNTENCTIGMTALVLALVILYWIVLFAVVFLMMRFKFDIGHLHAITYYYSVVDLLLSHNWYLSNSLYTVINVMSSITKVTPQFLGQLCFIKNMSGIDQQFIHYVHPIAVSLFLVIITVLARKSHRLALFVSKVIIRVICCLLLLSYTSVATTSLLLMRPLIFHDVDKVYTYVSPDVEYFHGRHLAYGVVAVLFTLVIVIGLPLLLVLEPFLAAKVNFVKIKPLLDQFQYCYKDKKYRCFAAYYMICRLIIITIIIANSSNDFIYQYLLIASCVIIALIHYIFKPYHNHLLNVFDGVVLQFLVLVSVLPLVEFFDSFNANLVVVIAFILVVLPSAIFIIMKLITSRGKIKSLIGYCYFKCSQLRLRSQRYNEIPLDDTGSGAPPTDFGVVIDDRRKINATVCTV